MHNPGLSEADGEKKYTVLDCMTIASLATAEPWNSNATSYGQQPSEIDSSFLAKTCFTQH